MPGEEAKGQREAVDTRYNYCSIILPRVKTKNPRLNIDTGVS